MQYRSLILSPLYDAAQYDWLSLNTWRVTIVMSQLLEYTKKLTKNREKKSKNYSWFRIFWSEKWANFWITPKKWQKIEKKTRKLFLAQNGLHRIMSQLSDDTKKLTKNREKDSKIIFGSKWSEENNEPTFRLYQKIEIFFGSELSEANNELTFRIH